jgi:hypothetical protein
LWLLAAFVWPEVVEVAGAVAQGDPFETPWGRFWREKKDKEREKKADEELPTDSEREARADEALPRERLIEMPPVDGPKADA